MAIAMGEVAPEQPCSAWSFDLLLPLGPDFEIIAATSETRKGMYKAPIFGQCPQAQRLVAGKLLSKDNFIGSKTVVVTSQVMLNTHFIEKIPRREEKVKTKNPINLGIERVIVDEAHVYSDLKTSVLKAIRELNVLAESDTRVMLVTGIPMMSKPKSFTVWQRLLDLTDKKVKESGPPKPTQSTSRSSGRASTQKTRSRIQVAFQGRRPAQNFKFNQTCQSQRKRFCIKNWDYVIIKYQFIENHRRYRSKEYC